MTSTATLPRIGQTCSIELADGRILAGVVVSVAAYGGEHPPVDVRDRDGGYEHDFWWINGRYEGSRFGEVEVLHLA